jgi:superfamily I DNA and/or RNA helicase
LGLNAIFWQKSTFRGTGTVDTKHNKKEAEITVQIAKNILNYPDQTLRAKDIGILSPYNGQIKLVKDLLGTKEGPWSSKSNPYSKLNVHTVDGFQVSIILL